MKAPHCEAIIVGAGPVGLLLACLLGQRGIRTLLLEKRTEPIIHSHAIGITPPSLHILEKLDLAKSFIDQGVKVVDCIIHGEHRRLGCMSFRDIPDDYRFILSLPQSETIRLLKAKLTSYPSVSALSGMEITHVAQDSNHCEIRYLDAHHGTTHSVTTDYLCASDGSRSRVRDILKIPTEGKSYRCHFVMGDFIDRSDLGAEAHLYFTSRGSIESFPLPNSQRRWIVQTPERLDSAPAGLISEIVQQRTGLIVPASDQQNQNIFTPRRLNCVRYHEGRVLLLGDAAHVMSPIGGQGMNTGFADAEFLADALDSILRRHAAHEPLFNAYNRYRRRAASIAIARAGRGMWLGTWQGKPASALRDLLLDRLFLNGPFSKAMAPYFAMLTIPFNTLDRVPLPPLRLPSSTTT
ncbi:FAD-dependent monooxygenase [Phragmitibacter flavus]|uniref:FAD-dependent monooxygenase n=1 Tax=Phragmitibacter flavus TaxID=2576071 RepID=A0A5R8KKJ9_9BACT|nr:NAD(P)/FAD-dependent oxidoreductase [Phragmitibacter flavus]TLD72822.1 FAD-dependent monooxygenase [Phragmitibacter flavus]